jgi:hypothetical protein
VKLQTQLDEVLNRVIGQYDNYAFFVGKFYKDEVEELTEYCGYPVFLVLIISEKDETVYFAPINYFFMPTMN